MTRDHHKHNKRMLHTGFAALTMEVRRELVGVFGEEVLGDFGKNILTIDTGSFLRIPGVQIPERDLRTELTVQAHTFGSDRSQVDEVQKKASLLGVPSATVLRLWNEIEDIRATAVEHRGDIEAARKSVMTAKDCKISAALSTVRSWTRKEREVASIIRDTHSPIRTKIEVDMANASEVNAIGALGYATALYLSLIHI